MRSTILILAALLFAHQATAEVKTWTVREVQDDGRVRIRVYEEELSLHDRQKILSQQLVGDQTLSRLESFKYQARKVPLQLPQEGRPLWTPLKNAWSVQDEDEYSAWIAKQVGTDFLNDTNLKVDCADTGLLFRWVYARMNLLPVANTLGSGKLFGHFSSSADWDRLPTNSDWKLDLRFQAALRYLFDNTYTHTLASDLAPVGINVANIRPGVLFMMLGEESGHTQTVQGVDSAEGIMTLWGNEPAATSVFLTPILTNQQALQFFGTWRTVTLVASVWKLKSADEMPGYSLEMYQKKFLDQAEVVNWVDGLLGIQISDFEKFKLDIYSFDIQIAMRVGVTSEGIFHCFYKPCAPDSADYSNYSTGVRDARLLVLQAEIAKFLQKLPKDQTQNLLNGELGRVIFGVDLNYLDLLQNSAEIARLNSDPTVSFAARWGVDPAAPNLDFYSNAQVLSNLVYQRDLQLLWNGGNFDSSEIDSQIQKMYQLVSAAEKSAGFSPTALEATQRYFQNAALQSVGTSCGGISCKIADVIWMNGKDDRVSRWSSKAGDTIEKRWGL